MFLTDEQQAILNGEKGETMAKVMKTLVMYGDAFGADKMVPVTSEYNHLVTSFGLKMISPVYELMDQLIQAGELDVAVLHSDAKWFGMTYQEDKPIVAAALRALHDAGEYPPSLR